MGYACPVCDDPQVDARHLANHLAFTAILGREDHEAWLDEHAPGWSSDGEQELAERVADHAEESDYPQVFEDTTGRLESEHDGERSGELFEGEGHEGHDHLADAPGSDVPHEQANVQRDPETEAVLEEARELTREMLGEDGTNAEDGTDADTEDDA